MSDNLSMCNWTPHFFTHIYNAKVNQTLHIYRELKDCCFLLKTKSIFQGNTLQSSVEACRV